MRLVFVKVAYGPHIDTHVYLLTNQMALFAFRLVRIARKDKKDGRKQRGISTELG